MPPPSGAPGGAPAGGPGEADVAQEAMKGIINMGKQIEQSLIMFAQAMPNGAKFFQQANEFIQQGIAAEMAAAAQEGGEAPASSPTEAGKPFPGGGLGSAGRP